MTSKGQHHTLETRRKMSDSKPKRPVIAISMKEPHETTVYESTRAALADGFASSNITAACKGRLRHCYGFWWRYLDEYKDIETVLAEAKARPHAGLHAVVAIDPETKTFKTFPSVSSVKDVGLTPESVYSVLAGRSRTHGGMYWRNLENFSSVGAVLAEEQDYDQALETSRRENVKAFARLDVKTEKIMKIYESAAAAECEGFVRAMIYRAAQRGSVYQGFKWREA